MLKKILLLFLFVSLGDLKPVEDKAQCYNLTFTQFQLYGCETDRMKIRFDMAKQLGYQMVLLPGNEQDATASEVFFAVKGYPLQQTYLQDHADDLALVAQNPQVAVLQADIISPFKNLKNCVGSELVIGGSMFAHEIYFTCESESKNFGIIFVFQAKNKKSRNEYLPEFITWVEPHILKDPAPKKK
ncbi:MAG: hypothetical protein H7A24_06790 [Leptospiraceae bacterium]|nr:hypothetical protein [Leptospiraceae bacterium]MCP5511569.1 hypothetical protein [Leptospiraceae bacterium]